MKNNYCTNCGKKLKKYEIVCEKCNTPIVKIPEKITPPEIINKRKRRIMIISIIIACIIIISFCAKIINNKKIEKIKQNYAIPFINENAQKYKGIIESIEYDGKGKCISYITSPNGCPSQAVYSNDKNCESYYYKIKVKSDLKDDDYNYNLDKIGYISRENEYDYYIVTVYYKDKKYNTIMGREIKDNQKKEYYIYE